METFGDRLKSLRKEKKIGQIELAKQDWAMDETTFEFRVNPLIDVFKTQRLSQIKECSNSLKTRLSEMYNQFEINEHRITDIFLEAYKLNDVNNKLYEYRCLFDLISSQDPNLQYSGQDLTEYYNSIENTDGAKNETQKN